MEIDLLRGIALSVAGIILIIAAILQIQTIRIMRRTREMNRINQELMAKAHENAVRRHGAKAIYSDEMLTPEDLEADAFHEECGDR